MRVSPDPWHPDEPDSMEEARPRRTEGMRITLYVLVTFALLMGFTLINRTITDRLMSADPAAYFTLGRKLAAYSTLISYLQPMVIMLVNRRVTFRSSRPVVTCLLLMLAAAFVWELVSGLVLQFLGRHGAEMLMRASMITAAASHLLYYLYQRFIIFRNTLDTL